jgi:hypothetical protein
MGGFLKIVLIVLAVGLLAVVVADTRVCLGDPTLGSNIRASAATVTSCVRARLEDQQNQLKEQISQRFQDSSAPR